MRLITNYKLLLYVHTLCCKNCANILHLQSAAFNLINYDFNKLSCLQLQQREYVSFYKQSVE